MKVIFLDIDGVLHTPEYCYEKFSPESVKCLNRIIKDSGAKVVISSSWRVFWSIEELQEKFNKSGVICEIIDCTLKEELEYRGAEIKEWLKGKDIDSFVIIDDISDMRELNNRLVLTEFEDGLQEYHYEDFFEILNTPYNPEEYEV